MAAEAKTTADVYLLLQVQEQEENRRTTSNQMRLGKRLCMTKWQYASFWITMFRFNIYSIIYDLYHNTLPHLNHWRRNNSYDLNSKWCVNARVWKTRLYCYWKTHFTVLQMQHCSFLNLQNGEGGVKWKKKYKIAKRRLSTNWHWVEEGYSTVRMYSRDRSEEIDVGNIDLCWM